MEEYKKVAYKYYNSESESWVKGSGIFHKWGSDVKYYGEKYFPISFAVIEDDEGQLHRVPEDGLKFITD